MKMSRLKGVAYPVLMLMLGLTVNTSQAQNAPDHPAVTVHGHTYTPRSILARNMGTEDDQTAQFPPHKIIGNIYYVGTRTLSSFLVVTPQGNILIDSTYERNVPTIEKSVQQLGFKFSDIKILLGSHAHGDHQEGDALVKQKTGAQVMAMAEDIPALKEIRPGGKDHPIDKMLHDGESVTLGGTTLVAHLTPGHTRGCTTWTLKAQENGRPTTSSSSAASAPIPDSDSWTTRRRRTSPMNSSGRSRWRARCRAMCHWARIPACTTSKRSTRSSGRAARIRSSIRRDTSSKWTSTRRCSAPAWPSRRT